ncbi:MAG: septum formation initiator family protein [Clostridia bacterium]|nr:septum formation initiator family protein [Clostridia bacterium]
MASSKYFADKKSAVSIAIRAFLLLLLLFAVAFFLWSVMRYNEIMEDKEEKEDYILQLEDDIDKLEYLVEAPLDDAYKIRIAREKLGMCFPDEIIYHTELD